jgi:hypothetical protein
MADAGPARAEHPHWRDQRIVERERRIDLINPLAIGVTIGGLLLDIVVPRPKPRVGPAPSTLPTVRRRPEDTLVRARVEHERPPVAGVVSS